MSRTRIPILLRHRWIAFHEMDVWHCHPRAVGLMPSINDPLCRGCRAVIDFDQLPDLGRYADPESLQYRLDLLYAELAMREGDHAHP